MHDLRSIPLHRRDTSPEALNLRKVAEKAKCEAEDAANSKASDPEQSNTLILHCNGGSDLFA